jgi:hypothetical protein
MLAGKPTCRLAIFALAQGLAIQVSSAYFKWL